MDKPNEPQPKTVILPPDEDDAAIVDLRFRFDGWTAGKQRAFLTALGDTGCIKDACRMVGMSKTSAYRLRTRSADFAAAWDRALEMAGTVLEQVAFQRAVVGIEEPVWQHGKYMGTRRRYSDGLLRLLIMRGDLRRGVGRSKKELEQLARGAAAAAGGFFGQEATREETNQALRKYLGAYRRKNAMERVKEAERRRLEGKVP